MKPGRRRLTAAALAALAVIILTAATLWVATAYARRSPVIACRLGPGVALYSSLGPLPEAIAGKLAGPAGYGRTCAARRLLNGTDVAISGLPVRRRIGAGRSGDRWFLWYEHGGYAPHAHLVLFDLAADAKRHCCWRI
jgi:hypothetical protein